MSLGKYILDAEGNPVVEDDLMKWAAWMQKADKLRSVGDDVVGHVRVSTVFLGLDHNLMGDGEHPIIFETMTFHVEHEEKEIFGKKMMTTKDLEDEYQYQERYATKTQAQEGHARIVAELREKISV